MSELTAPLVQVIERLVTLAHDDGDLRLRLRVLAQAILRWTDGPVLQQAMPAAPEAPPVELPTAAAAAVEAPVPEQPPAKPPVALPPLTFRQESVTEQTVSIPEGADVSDADLPRIEARCRMKAEGARWAAKRRQRMAEGADFRLEIEPLDREIIERAKGLPDCFLWTNHPSGPSPSDVGLFNQLAGCFETLADAIELVRGLLNDPSSLDEYLDESLLLLSEAQSALREAVQAVGYNHDRDQLRAYNWLRGATWQRRIYISRFMKIDDPADPAGWPDLSNRISNLQNKLDEARQQAKRKQSAIKRIRYHLNLVQGDPGRDHTHDWDVVIKTIEELVQGGMPASNVEIREMLLPVIDRLPEMELPPGVSLVIRELDRFLSTRPTTDLGTTLTSPIAEVRQAAGLLRGRTLVLIGGLRRPQAEQALIDAFGLAGLRWIETREHESLDSFEPQIARPEVAAVLLAIRWSSHSFGKVKPICDRYGKPLVRLPAGYSPNQVAVQIVQQVSGKLGQNGQR